MIAIASFATKSYFFAWPQMVRRVAAAVSHHDRGVFILSTDKTKEGDRASAVVERELPSGWETHRIQNDIGDDTSENYKPDAQLRIAQLQGSAFALARKLNVDACLSIESDVLVPPDALRLCEWAVSMPDKYYEIAMVTYPNGSFLGGRGRQHNGIEKDFLPHERKIGNRLGMAMKECEKRLATGGEKEQKRWERLNKKADACPLDGNIFEIIGKHGWRRRGWLENAYPGIGRGALLPTDWVGLGCTYLTKRALELATFDGYEGRGTQDLFLCCNRWMPNNVKMCVITHSLCDHVKPKRGQDGKRTGEIEHLIAYHEQDGEFAGHLRTRSIPWIPL